MMNENESNFVTKLVYRRKVGTNVQFCYNCWGNVIYEQTVIEDNVRIYQNVTIGQVNSYTLNPASFTIGKGAILCAGAKIIGKKNLVVGKNTIIASNAVLFCSTGDNEIWGGILDKNERSSMRNTY